MGVSAIISSGLTGRVSAGCGAEGMPSSSGMALALGEGLRADRCQRKSLTEGDVIAAGVDVRVWGGQGIRQGV